eukprot:2773787-Pyramimonas_sp.AAC.1
MEMREAIRVRLEQSTQFQPAKRLAALRAQTPGEHSLVARMTEMRQAARSSADAPPVLPPEETPAAGPFCGYESSEASSCPGFAQADATTPEDAPPARTQAIPTAYGEDWDGNANHSEREERYYI